MWEGDVIKGPCSGICQLRQRGKCHQWARGNVDLGPEGQQGNGEESQQGTGEGISKRTRMKMSNRHVPTRKQPIPNILEVEVVETPAAVELPLRARRAEIVPAVVEAGVVEADVVEGAVAV